MSNLHTFLKYATITSNCFPVLSSPEQGCVSPWPIKQLPLDIGCGREIVSSNNSVTGSMSRAGISILEEGSLKIEEKKEIVESLRL